MNGVLRASEPAAVILRSASDEGSLSRQQSFKIEGEN